VLEAWSQALINREPMGKAEPFNSVPRQSRN